MSDYTLAEYKQLKAARARGVLIVTQGDPPKTVRYRSLDEIDRILKSMEEDLGVKSSQRYTVATHYRQIPSTE